MAEMRGQQYVSTSRLVLVYDVVYVVHGIRMLDPLDIYMYPADQCY